MLTLEQVRELQNYRELTNSDPFSRKFEHLNLLAKGQILLGHVESGDN